MQSLPGSDKACITDDNSARLMVCSPFRRAVKMVCKVAGGWPVARAALACCLRSKSVGSKSKTQEKAPKRHVGKLGNWQLPSVYMCKGSPRKKWHTTVLCEQRINQVFKRCSDFIKRGTFQHPVNMAIVSTAVNTTTIMFGILNPFAFLMFGLPSTTDLTQQLPALIFRERQKDTTCVLAAHIWQPLQTFTRGVQE